MAKKHMSQGARRSELKERSNLPERRRESFNPLREFARMQSNLDRIMDEIVPSFGTLISPLSPVGRSLEQMMFVPPVDVEESRNEYRIAFDLPGVDKDNINIQLQDNQLIVSGERHEEHEFRDPESNALSSERSYGQFQRAFVLPESVNAEQVQAMFQDGVLRIRIPKSEESQPKLIKISEGRRTGSQIQMEGTSGEKAAEPVEGGRDIGEGREERQEKKGKVA